MTDDELAHLSHCTEILRQAVMCHADLALERPTDTTVWPQRVSVRNNFSLNLFLVKILLNLGFLGLGKRAQVPGLGKRIDGD